MLVFSRGLPRRDAPYLSFLVFKEILNKLVSFMALLYPLLVQGRVAKCSYPSSDAGLKSSNSHLGNFRDPS